MRRKSGNGTSTRQWLYIFWNLPYFWIVKIGIGGNVKKRLKQVDKSAKGIDFCVFKIKVRWAYQAEQFIHDLCSFMQVRFNGSGHTERFLFPAVLVALPVALFVFMIEWGLYIGLVFLISYLFAHAG